MTPPPRASLVDPTQPTLWLAIGHVVFNPLAWNIISRNEYRNKTITKLVGTPHRGVALLGTAIFVAGLSRDVVFAWAMEHQPKLELLDTPLVKYSGYTSIALGLLLVLSSTYQLGLVNTYLGDYFGLLMEKRVTEFPFSVLEHPMYYGSTLNFFGTSLIQRSPAGLLITLSVALVYQIAQGYEGDFTGKIYAEREKKRGKKK
ncbi:phospholipid methyltransferase [Gonapodya prolifera JEL478]|uniref:Phosphatidyl-N-methylethanolamine N-methyltransferase n=1 Tax=Gonapodya prolifera (strain JEL478) TaxID=1344416 RepID=A0A139A1U2_GONPJ|nr:phospholipid methyltransferase [Gonapodya prolifera JEL478]|eukprot:KXS10333.1 phospholipid methyltransferase [Gonapodya prolifera JEL478]